MESNKTPKSPHSRITLDDAINEALLSPHAPTTNTAKKVYNSRLYWPDIINTPNNKWTFSCVEIIEKLDKNEHKAIEEKKNMEKCLMYFYTMKKKLNLFDHTYTAASILFFRFWYVYGLPASLINCIHVSQAILVTACKTMENNRPIDAYIRATCEYINQMIYGNRNSQNVDKLKWEVRDKLVNYEQRILTHFGFDINIDNPKEIVEDIFSGFYRYNRDFELPTEFKEILPKLLIEVRSFIIQAVTQPVSLLCDGYSFLVLAMLYCGIQYKKKVDENFKYPENFFKDRFPIEVNAEKFAAYFTDYRLLEQSFFDLKSNKDDKLQISIEEIESILQESPVEETEIGDPYSYEKIKSGEVQQELLDHIEERVNEYINRMTSGRKHSHGEDGSSSQTVSTSTSPSHVQEPASKRIKL